MSQPNEPWEEHWRDTLAEHEASPPSAHDWGGMEQLLDAPVVPASPIAAPAPKPALPVFKLPALPWPVWVLALAFVLALGYWLGNQTAVSVSQEMDTLQKKTSLVEAVMPPIDTVFDKLYFLDANRELTDEIASVEWAIVNSPRASSPQNSPEINTSNPAGGGKNLPSPAISLPLSDADDSSTAPTLPPSGAGAERRLGDIAPAPAASSVATPRRPDASTSGSSFSFESSSEQAARPNRGGYVRPLRTLMIPTDRELLEQRVNALSLSEKLVITPVRYKNGHFPAYRPRQ